MSVKFARWVHKTAGTATEPATFHLKTTGRFVACRSTLIGRNSQWRDYGASSLSSGGIHNIDADSHVSAPPNDASHETSAMVESTSMEKGDIIDKSSQVVAASTKRERRSTPPDVFGGLPIDLDSKYLNVEYAFVLYKAVKRNKADLALRCLIAAAKKGDMKFVRSISNTTFTDILILHRTPETFDKLAASHRYVSPMQQVNLRTTPIDQVAHHHYKILRFMFRLRRFAGAELTLEQYLFLLKSARDLGKSGFAYALFKHLEQAGHATNIECWNLLLEAVVFSHQHRPETRHTYRVTLDNFSKRSQPIRHRRFLNYRVQDADRGLKSTISQIFDQMCEAGATANQTTYRVLLIAAGREGDMASVAAILNTAWGIQLDGLDTGGNAFTRASADPNEEAVAVSECDRETLHAIVQVFLINNNIPMALRALQTTSLKFNIRAGRNLWEEILEYATLLARPKSRQEMDASSDSQEVMTLSSVREVWEAFQSTSNDLKPTMNMYKHMIKALQNARMPQMMLGLILQSVQEFGEEGHHLRRKEDRLLKRVSLMPKKLDKTWDTERAQWERAQLTHRSHAVWMRRSVQAVFDSTRRTVDVRGDLTLRELPQAISKLRFFTPYRVSYELLGGIIEFDFKPESSHENLEKYKAMRATTVAEIKRTSPRMVGLHLNDNQRRS